MSLEQATGKVDLKVYGEYPISIELAKIMGEVLELPQFQTYQPEIWQVDKTAIYNARAAISLGLYYAKVYKEKLDNTEESGRIREMVENDIRRMAVAIKELKAYEIK